MGSKDFTPGCCRCSLSERRKQVVFGVGNIEANLILCGKSPNRYEDNIGKPFVGKQGGIVDMFLEPLGLDRKKVFVTNVCLCRPVNEKGNTRKLKKHEIRACRPRLIKTLRHIGHYGVLMGLTASEAVLKVSRPLWGRPVYVKKLSKWFLPVKHPSWYLRGKQNYLSFGITEFVNGVKEMRRLCKLGDQHA